MTSTFLRLTTLLGAVLTMGMAAGTFALYADTIMPGLRKTDDRTFVGAFQQIDRAIINPWFMIFAFGGALVLTGTYNAEGEVSRRLLDALPSRLVLRRDEWQTPVLGLLAAEMPRDEVGQDAVLDRLLDLLLIDAVRTHFSRAELAAPGWYRARRDPVVAQAVRLLQESPAEPWTVGTLARQTRVSRATLARRFADVVGQPPMEFLTQWRVTLAADLILDPAETVASVARAVGYSSPYALSAAFKRVRGVSPHQHRTAERESMAQRERVA